MKISDDEITRIAEIVIDSLDELVEGGGWTGVQKGHRVMIDGVLGVKDIVELVLRSHNKDDD